MTKQQDILTDLAARRITAVWIGEVLDVTEKTARKRLADGLPAGDVITLCRAADVNPVTALVEMDMLTPDEVHGYLDSDGKLLASADEHELIVELADRAMTTTELGSLIARRPEATPKESAPTVSLDAYRRQNEMAEVPDNVPLAANHGEKGIPDIPSEAEESQVNPEDDGFDPA